MEMYQSPCHNSLEAITSIITIIREIVLTFMHQLAQLKQVIGLSATGGNTFAGVIELFLWLANWASQNLFWLACSEFHLPEILL